MKTCFFLWKDVFWPKLKFLHNAFVAYFGCRSFALVRFGFWPLVTGQGMSYFVPLFFGTPQDHQLIQVPSVKTLDVSEAYQALNSEFWVQKIPNGRYVDLNSELFQDCLFFEDKSPCKKHDMTPQLAQQKSCRRIHNGNGPSVYKFMDPNLCTWLPDFHGCFLDKVMQTISPMKKELHALSQLHIDRVIGGYPTISLIWRVGSPYNPVYVQLSFFNDTRTSSLAPSARVWSRLARGSRVFTPDCWSFTLTVKRSWFNITPGKWHGLENIGKDDLLWGNCGCWFLGVF